MKRRGGRRESGRLLFEHEGVEWNDKTGEFSVRIGGLGISGVGMIWLDNGP